MRQTAWNYNPSINTLQSFGDFLTALFDAIGLSLTLNPAAAKYVGVSVPQIAVVVAVAFVGGVSLLAGQSVVLFMNRISKTRFIISLLLNGAIYVFNLAVWSSMIWLVAVLAFGVAKPIGIGAMAILLGSAPFVFGFLILVPYLGLIFARIFYAWSFLSTLVVLQAVLQINWVQALVCVAAGWLLSLVLNRTIGKPISRLRDRIFRRVLGSAAYGGSASPEGDVRSRRIGLRTEAALLRRRADDILPDELEIGKEE